MEYGQLTAREEIDELDGRVEVDVSSYETVVSGFFVRVRMAKDNSPIKAATSFSLSGTLPVRAIAR